MDYNDKFKEEISLDVDDAIGVCNDLLNRYRDDEKAENIILEVFAELFDCSVDSLLDFIYQEDNEEVDD
jgi:hypothetical protein